MHVECAAVLAVLLMARLRQSPTTGSKTLTSCFQQGPYIHVYSAAASEAYTSVSASVVPLTLQIYSLHSNNGRHELSVTMLAIIHLHHLQAYPACVSHRVDLIQADL